MKRQVSDTMLCGILLALSGGCMDAYSFLCRGRVFANAQTGNILLFGVKLADGDWNTALHYLWPVLAFAAGIVISDIIDEKKTMIRIHWRQISVLIEAVILLIVAFLPDTVNALANALTSFACGIQVESFREIHGHNVATTMCIGNLRSGTYNAEKFLHSHERVYLRKVLLYFGLIVSFVAGAVIEGRLIGMIGSHAIHLSSALLIAALLIMFRGVTRDVGDTPSEN